MYGLVSRTRPRYAANRMPKGYARTHCKRCQRSKAETGGFSARGKCASCGETLVIENNRQLAAHDGPFFEHWRRRSLAALGVFLPLPSPTGAGDSEREPA